MHSRFAKIFVESKRKQGDKDTHRVDQVVKCLAYVGGDVFLFTVYFY